MKLGLHPAKCLLSCASVISAWLLAPTAMAATFEADPTTYLSLLKTLKPGDTMKLAPGTYTGQLPITGLNGTNSAPITITGPDTAIFVASDCCNTVELINSSYVVVQGFTLDGHGLEGAFGVSAKGGASNFTHHITVDGLTIKNYGGAQQTVGISTKTPSWGWVIRKNRIVGAGTGIYLGNSNGAESFFDGIIEGNIIVNPIGYCMQIKRQAVRPARTGQPISESRTVIRHNVFIKNDAPSPDGDRPNVLVDGPPPSGPGANDRSEVYGNLFYHNARESLMQASGRVSVHDNVFVDAADAALLLSSHDGPLLVGNVYNNTIYGAGVGVRFGSAPTEAGAVVGNLIFADTGVAGNVGNKRDNLELQVADAPDVVAKPSTILGAMDFYPRTGQAVGTPLDLGAFAGDLARDVDFNGSPKAPPVYRGAYHGSGSNPGWALGDGLKDAPLPTGPGDGNDGGAGPPGSGSNSDGGPGSAAAATGGTNSGGCTIGRGAGGLFEAISALALVAMVACRRRRLGSDQPPRAAVQREWRGGHRTKDARRARPFARR